MGRQIPRSAVKTARRFFYGDIELRPKTGEANCHDWAWFGAKLGRGNYITSDELHKMGQRHGIIAVIKEIPFTKELGAW